MPQNAIERPVSPSTTGSARSSSAYISMIQSLMFCELIRIYQIYCFQVGNAGDIYEGRGWGVVGAHAPNYNSRSVGIAVLGNFTGNLLYTNIIMNTILQ